MSRLPRRRSSAATSKPGRHRAVPEPTSGRARRASAMVAAVLAMSGTLVGVTAVTTTATASAAPAPFACDSFGYLFQGDGGDIFKIDLATGQDAVPGPDPTVNVPAASTGRSINAVGYNPRDNLFYGNDVSGNGGAGGIDSIDANYTRTALGLHPAGLTDQFAVGEFDPQGHLWMANASANPNPVWIEVDLSSPTSPTYGQTIRNGTMIDPTDPGTGKPYGGGVDWGWINGSLYRVMNTGGTEHLVRFTPPTALGQSPNPIVQRDLGPVGFTGSNQGAVYAQQGYLWTSDNTSGDLHRIDVANVATTFAHSGPQSSSNDGARCATAPIPTMTVTKQVAGRAAANDQFTVTLAPSAGAAVGSATTSGSQTTASTTNLPVTQNATYTITDAMAAGSASPLSSYTPTIVCRDTGTGATLATTGSAPSWRVTIPGTDDYACTVTNTVIQNDLRITKTGPATTTANGIVTWTLGVTNLSGANSPRDTVVDTLPPGFTNVTAAGCTVAGLTVTCQQGALAVGDPARTITISAQAPPTYSTPYVNTAHVSGPVYDPNQVNNDASFTTRVNDGTLALSKKVSTATSAPAQTANAVPGQVVTYTITATDTGGGAWSAANPATFSDDLSDVLKDATYVDGSATASVGTVAPPVAGGTTLGWSGVPSGSTPVTVTYQVRVGDPDLAGDYTMVNTVSSPFAPGCAPALCQTTTSIAQLRVAKAVTSSTTPATPGSTLNYTVTVSNPGTGAWPATGAADTATVADDFSDVVASGTYNSDAAVNAGNNAGATTAQLTRTASGLSWSGPLPAGTGFTITYSVTIKDPFTGPDYDLTNTVTAPHSNCTAPGTAGCTTTTPVADLIATKTSPTVTPLPGGTVSYTITLRNPGSAAWNDATRPTATDNLADVLDDATWNNDVVATLPGGAAATGMFGPTPSTTVPLTWTGTVPAGQTVSITYGVTVDSPFRAGSNQTLVNGVLTPVGPCGPNGAAAACPTVTQNVPGLTTTKLASSGVANPGQQVSYTITLLNDGKAAWPAGTQLFTDDLSDVLDDAALTAGPTATNEDDAALVTRTGNTLVYKAALGAGHAATIRYTVTVASPGTGNHNLANTVVPIVPCSSGCATTTAVPDLTVKKTADTADASEGTRVGYTVTATNTGGTAWTTANPAIVTDDMSAALDDASFDGNVAVVIDGIPVDSSGVVRTATGFTWSGPLAQNSTVTLGYSVVVNTPDTGDRIMPNAIVTPNGGSCSTGSADPNCTTTTRNATLDVTKVASTTTTSEGSVVEYTITATNNGQGNWTAANPAVITDDLSRVVDDATPGNAVATGAAEAIVTQPTYIGADRSTLRWSGSLNAGSQVQIKYSVTVNTPDTGDHVLRNTVVAPGGTCRAGCSTTTNVATLTVTKTSDLQDAAPGSVVKYTITATAGGGDFTAANPASLKDDLSDVLDDATFNGDAATAGDSTVAPDTSALPTLSWSGPLAAGQSITITYSVTVNAPGTGNRKLINTVTGPSGNCRAGCSTTTNVPDLVVSKTASSSNAYPGAVIQYTITAANNTDGAWTATRPARLSDDLSGLLDDATFDNDVTIEGSSVTPAYNAPILSWEGALAARSSITIRYSVTIKSPDTGDHRIVNTVAGPPGTNCAAGSTAAACSTTGGVADLTVAKTSTAVNTGPGQQVTYTLSVLSSGTGDWTAATPAVITDDLSDVLDDATYNNDVVTMGDSTVPADASSLPKLTWTGPLAAGQSITIRYSVTVNDPDTGDHRLVNAVTALGNCVVPAAPGCSTTTLAADLQVTKTADRQNAVPGSVLTYTLVVRNDGEGDWTAANPAVVRDDLSGVLDDATYNNDATADTGAGAFDFTAPALRWTGSLAAKTSLTITYSVTVNTPVAGDHRLVNAVSSVGNCRTGCSVESLVPDLTVTKKLISGATGGATQPGATLTYAIVATNSGAGAWTATNPATLSDDLSGLLDDAVYNNDAAITGASAIAPTYTAPTISWSGPLAAAASVTVTYSVTVNSPDRGDHALPNTVVGPVGTGCAAGSTDPDCVTSTGIADLAVSKVASTQDSGPGQTVTYTIIANSVGTAPWTSAYAPVVDDLSKVLDDATFNADAAAVITSPAGNTTVTQPTYTTPKVSWSGDLAVGDTVTITYSVTVNDPDTGDHQLLNAVSGAGNCADPTAPGCSTTTKIADLQVTKTADRQDAAPGSVLTYSLVVRNNGEGDWTAANPAVVSDDLSKVLDDATYNNDATTDPSAGAFDFTAPTLRWTGSLAAKASLTITYSVTVNTPVTGDHRLINTVSSVGSCRAGNTDPGCTVESDVPDLTVSKASSSAAAEPGATLTYTITATNSGAGNWTATSPATLSDNLSGLLDDAVYNDDVTITGASAVRPTYAAPTISWSAPLAAGASVTITYSVTVNSPDRGDHTLPNAAVGPVGTGCAAGSTDPDCVTSTGIADLAISKTASTQNIGPGQTVTYTVTATSVGTAPWTSAYAPVTDDLSELLDDATYNGDAASVLTSVTGATTVAQPTYTEPTIAWVGDLAVGDAVTITYSVTVDDPDTGDHELPNTIAGAGNCADPTDPTCTTATLIADLTVTKTADKTNVAPGGKVTYTVTARNNGAGDWTDTNPAALTDDLSKVIDDATWNGDVTIDGSPVQPTYTAPTLSWSGALAAGGTVTITYSVTVKSPVTGDHRMGNTVVSAIGDCEAGTTNTACSAEPKIPDLNVVKTASSSVAEPGKTITYKIVVTNTGAGDWTAAEPAVVRDDLSKVLDDAAWNGDAAVTGNVGIVKYTKPTLNWTGPLAAGAAVTITYSVTVATLGTGDHQLRNTVSADAGNCIDPAAAGCATNTPAASYTVTKTSDPASGAPVKPGQTVHYRLTIKNTGQVDLNPVVTDDMTQALDDATYNGDGLARTGSATFSKPTLTWTGPLPIGATTVVTYSLTVHTDGRGDGKLLNVVVGNGPETNCSDSTQCTTNSDISSETISNTPAGSGPPAYTGVDSRTLLLIAGLMLLIGMLAILFGRGGASGGSGNDGPRGPQGPNGGSRPRNRLGRRLLTALIAVVAAVGLTACTSGSSGSPAPATSKAPVNSSAPVTSTGGGAATVSIDGVRADLKVTSCTASKSLVQVVAQAGAAWTAQLRQDSATRSTFLVLVHQTGKTVRTYQASATAAHPRGLGATRISAVRKGKSFSARATLTSSSATLGAKSAVSKPGRTRDGTFAATCTRPGG